MPPIPILYLHGFASSPESAKLVALRGKLGPHFQLNAPDLNVPSFERLDWNAMADLAVGEGRRVPPRVIVGSSLGALLALETVRRGVVAPLVLIAPALGIGGHWVDRLAPGDPVIVPNYARGTDAPIHRAFFEQMARVEADAAPPVAPVTVIMGRADQTIPFAVVEEVWRRWQRSGTLAPESQMVAIDGGDHSLVGWVDEIARRVRSAA